MVLASASGMMACRRAAAARRSAASGCRRRRARSRRSAALTETARRCCSRLERGRDRRFGQRRDGRHRHVAAVRGLDEDALEVARIVDRARGREHAHRIAGVVDEDGADIGAVDHRLHGGGEAVDVDAERRRLVAVDGQRQLRLGGVVVDGDAAEARVLAAARRRSSARLGRTGRSWRRPRRTACRCRRRGCPGCCDWPMMARTPGTCTSLVDLGRDLLLAARALVPGRQRQRHEAARGVGAEARNREDRRYLADFDAAAAAGPRSSASAVRVKSRLTVCGAETRTMIAARSSGGVSSWRRLPKTKTGRAGKQHGDDDHHQRRIEAERSSRAIEARRAAGRSAPADCDAGRLPRA